MDKVPDQECIGKNKCWLLNHRLDAENIRTADVAGTFFRGRVIDNVGSSGTFKLWKTLLDFPSRSYVQFSLCLKRTS